MSNTVRKRIAQFLALRAHELCEYCKVPQTATTHVVDHIIATCHGGESRVGNLALACWTCNAFKGPNLSSRDPETKKILRLFNPRTTRWTEHFTLSEGLIIPHTAVARATIFCLHMNDKNSIIYRKAFEEDDPTYLDRVKKSPLRIKFEEFS